MKYFIGNVFFCQVYLGLNSIIEHQGYPTKAMITSLVTVSYQVLFLLLYLFFLNGNSWAALATVCAQILGSFAVYTSLYKEKTGFLRFLPGCLKLKIEIIKDIISIGIKFSYANSQ